MEHSGNGGEIRSDVVLETVFTNVTEKFLHLRDLDYPGAPKGFQGIVSERTRADVTTNSPQPVIGGKARIAHQAGFNAPHAGAEGIILANRARNDLLIVHLDITEEMFGQVATMEAHRLIRITAIVIIPVEQGTGRFGG